ncbi:MAG: carbamoyltransferase HypF, partial [Planctomycetes bacterium]|nr:carbamoyltransferase HypF [Planctomycetota bacterium]
LPSGDKAIKQPQRTALGLLYECMGEAAFDLTDRDFLQSFPAADLCLLGDMLRKDIQCPMTSSAGRLFDGVASIIASKHKVSFEGQAAMELEFALHSVETAEYYPFEIQSGDDSALVVDWSPMMQAILTDASDGISIALCSAKFHNTLVEMIIDIAIRVDQKDVVLTGGCFQNRYLCENAV